MGSVLIAAGFVVQLVLQFVIQPVFASHSISFRSTAARFFLEYSAGAG